MAQALAKKVDAQFYPGSDPDADRVAVQVKEMENYTQITATKPGFLLDYLIVLKKRAGTLPKDAVAPSPCHTTWQKTLQRQMVSS